MKIYIHVKVKVEFSSVKVDCCILEILGIFGCICMLSTYFRNRCEEICS